MATHSVIVELVAKGQQAAAEFRKVRAEAQQLNATTSKVGDGAAGVDTLASKTGFLSTAMKGAAVAGAGLAAVKLADFARDSVKEFASATSEVRQFQRVSGASAETSSKLVYAFKAVGVSTDQAATGIFMLAKKIGSGKSALDQYGVSVARTAKGQVDIVGTIQNVADAYKATEDPARRAAIVQEAFGKSGKNLIPILGKSRQSIKELFDEAKNTHSIFSQDDLEKGRQYQLAVHALSETFSGFKREVGAELTPAITSLTQGFTEFLQVADDTGVLKAFGTYLAALVSPFKAVADTAHKAAVFLGLSSEATDQHSLKTKFLADATKEYTKLVDEGNGKSERAKELAHLISVGNEGLAGTQKKVSDALKTTAEKAKDADTALQNLKNTFLGLGDSQRGAQRAVIEYGRAQDELKTATDTLNAAKLAGRQGDETDEQFATRIAGLQRDQALALLGVGDAHDAVAKAAVDALTSQKAYDEAAKDPTARAALIASLEAARAKYGDTTGAIGDQITKLKEWNDTPTPAKFIDVETTTAEGKIAHLRAIIDSISHTFTITGNVNIPQFQHPTASKPPGWTGGPVPGGRDRAVDMTLHGGEYILDAGTVDAITRGAKSRSVPRSGSGATVSGSNKAGDVYNISVNALVADANAGRRIQEAINAHKRTGGS